MPAMMHAEREATWETRLFSIIPQGLLGGLFLPLALATYVLGAWNIFLLVLSVPLLCFAFLCAAQQGYAGIYLVLFFLANLLVSRLSSVIVERDHVLALLGVDFAVLITLFLILPFERRFGLRDTLHGLWPESLKYLAILTVFLGIYFLYGWFSGNGLAASAAYLRLYSFPFFFIVGLSQK